MRRKISIALILILALILCGTPHTMAADADSGADEPNAPGMEAPGTGTPGPEDPGTEGPESEAPGPEVPGPEAPGPEAPAPEAPGSETPGIKTPGPALDPKDIAAAFDKVQAADDPVVLTVAYTANGSPTEVPVTQSQIEPLLEGPYTYSNHNTFPSYGTNSSITGVRVGAVFTAAGIDIAGLDSARAVKFISGDGTGYSATVTWGQIIEDRYYYSQNGMQGAKVPAIIGISSSEFGEDSTSLPRNFFGQAAIGEQTRNLFVRSVARIEILGNAGTWGTASANPVSGTQVAAGDRIRLATPPGAPAEAKIYYTLDGSEPTRASTMYNLIAQQWFISWGITENAPIVVPEGTGTLTIRAKIMGLGMNDGTETVFYYPYKAAPGLLDQNAPQGLAGGVLRITGTTTAMEYNTSASAPGGWIRCSNGSTNTSVSGTYYVRFAATATHNPSPAVQVVVSDSPDKLNQAPPTGLTGGDKAINGTSTSMEYNTRSSATSGWIRCAAGSTGVEPGTYYVRFAATETHNASSAVMVVVEEEEEKGAAVISVYNGGRLAKAFSQSDIDDMQKHGPNTYSGHNTWPSYETTSGVTGVRVMDFLTAAGVGSLASGQSVRFTSGDGFGASLTVGQIEEPRYFYSSGGARGDRTPTVINMNKGGEYRRLVFGQAASGEQIRQALVKDVVRIDVQGGAGSWGSPTASPAQGGTVKKGDPIRLTMPSGQGDAKIYYTLDGSEPTRNSSLYNPVADRWLFQKGMSENTPIAAPLSSAFTIKAKIIGIGKSDGSTVSFTYNSQNREKESKEDIMTPTLDELKSGGVVVVSGKSIFIPGKPGSVSWNPDEMDGYYDEELGGYVLTPKEGVEGTIWFTYTDENGVVHRLSIYVEPAGTEETLSPEEAAALAAVAGGTAGGAGGGSDGSGPGALGGGGGGGGAGSVPLWLLITLCGVCAAAGIIFGPKLAARFRTRKNAA